MKVWAITICTFTIVSVFLFSSYAFETDICDDPRNTYEINRCLSLKIENAEKVLNKYFVESKNRYTGYPEVLAAISNSQKEWIQYRDAHCDSIYEIYKEGTIRGIMGGSCMLEVTYTRTHELWQNYLTYPDSTPPILPEPKSPLPSN
jgi:uncharacterized protein YecT (DUF1311 family)